VQKTEKHNVLGDFQVSPPSHTARKLMESCDS